MNKTESTTEIAPDRISVDALQATKSWLHFRESDIASGWEDLGELRPLFVDLFGREPKE